MTLLYEELGSTLGRAGDLIAGGVDPSTEQGQRELRQVALLLRRTAAMWSAGLLDALGRENRCLAATLDDLTARMAAAGIEADISEVPEGDLISVHRGIIASLHQAEAVVHDHAGEPWAREARRVLRAGLHAAAKVQGELVDPAWAIQA